MSERLVCTGLTKSFSAVRVLKGISLTARAGRTLGLVGENGAGKSTLMNLIGGVHLPDAGSMTLDGEPYAPASPTQAAHCGIAFVHQELNLFGNLSVAENMFITGFPRRFGFIDGQAMRARAAELLEKVDLRVSPETRVDALPQGERQLVEIAKALHGSSKLIILDEPTTSLSHRETTRLFDTMDRLRSQGIALVYISHALDDVMRVCDDLAILRDGELVTVGAREEFTRDRLIRFMVGRPIEQLYPERQPTTAGAVVLEARNVTQPGVIQDVSLQVRAGEVFGIAGLMGSGRSELARILFGLDPHTEGQVALNGADISHLTPRARIKQGMAFLTESRRDDGLFMDASIADNMAIVFPQVKRIPELCSTLGVKCANHDRQPVRQLSGGNQQKVALGKWLMEPPKLLILDEPTRGVDVGAKYEIYKLMNDLVQQGVALMVISSEVEELTGMSDRIIVMCKGEAKAEFTRPFDRTQILGAAV